jgi:hypothetical protein
MSSHSFREVLNEDSPMGEQLYRLSAFPDKRTALDVVHPQVHNYPGSALIDDPDVDHLSVLAGAIENPAASGRDALNVGAAARPLLMPGRLAGNPDPTLAGRRQVAWGNAEGGGGARPATRDWCRLLRLCSRERTASRGSE